MKALMLALASLVLIQSSAFGQSSIAGSAAARAKTQKYQDMLREPVTAPTTTAASTAPATKKVDPTVLEAYRNQVLVNSAKAKAVMEKEKASETARLWVTMWVNGHPLRKAPLLDEVDLKMVKILLSKRDVQAWVLAEDAYQAVQKPQ